MAEPTTIRPHNHDTAPMDRRSALRFLGAGAACAICAGAAEAADKPVGVKGAVHEVPHWGYGGAGAPENWGKLQPDFRVCEIGLQQPPIDLKDAVPARPGALETDFKAMPLRIVNNGHTIQVNCAPGSATLIGETRFELLQFHFHHPSEHLLSGKALDLECHFVHRSAAGDLAVLGVFMRRGGSTNAALTPIWDAMPAKEGPEVTTSAMIDPESLLPRNRGYFRYHGSLTTPPCSEGLIWSVFKESVDISDDQVRRFAALFPVNARPVQTLGKRFLLETN
jgi:carbonic anhydrase